MKPTPAHTFKVGDVVECIHDIAWQTRHVQSDQHKAAIEGRSFFTGCAAAYMHLNEGYVVQEVKPNGGLKLRGFAPTVSATDVRLSTKEVVR